ncbi:TspO/MBR family protein [Usitatibacter palustris]|uniref:Tryptophan-rich sensory protein n=1 Tax=Usitatibacter palustris TaxID=2732487 RepID=A0A6M4HB08_9PROT|nr:TspO/MBR family protein [Usitatibacter palustris]QJR16766.1 Tryptophan-rich sensory protein [Usitatibacter palustris]
MASRPSREFAAPDLDLFSLIFWIFLCVGGGALLGAFFQPDAWFRALSDPPFAPPNAVFAPVWTVLYILMGVAMWRVERFARSVPARIRARRAFLTQLALNFAWTPVFFGLHQIELALVVIFLLWIAIGVTFYLFRRADRTAGWLIAPYWAWVTFATALNTGYAVLN